PNRDGPDIKVIDLLDRAASEADTRFAGKDDLRALVHATLRNLYRRLGSLPKAQQEARAASEITLAMLGPDNPETLSTRAELALVAHNAGRSAEAEAELRKVLEAQRRVNGPADSNTIMTQTWLAQALKAEGKLPE